MGTRVRVRIDPEPERRPIHRFKKGDPRPEGAGRKKGVENKVKTLMKDALIIAASNIGSDGKGKDGLVGFFERAARRELVAYLRIMEKLLPYQITGKDGGPMQLQHTTKEELVLRLKERGLPAPPSLLSAPPGTPTFEDAQYSEIKDE